MVSKLKNSSSARKKEIGKADYSDDRTTVLQLRQQMKRFVACRQW